MQTNILEYFEHFREKRTVDKVAIIDQGRSYTFAELDRYSKRCAGLLIGRRNVINEPIAVFLPKSAGVIFADLGVAYSGNIYTNLDTKSPAQRIKAILDNIGPNLIITLRALAPHLAAIGVEANQLFFIEDVYDETIPVDSEALWGRLAAVIDTDPLCII